MLAFGDIVEMQRDDLIPARLTFPQPGAPRWHRLASVAFSRLHYAYGLWKTDVLRGVPWRHNDWFPDLPLMMAACMLGDFVQVPGAELRYRVRNNARYFALPPRPGIGWHLSNLRIRIRRAWHMARLPVLAAASVGRIAGSSLGLTAGALAGLKVAHTAAGYFWHWVRVQLGLLPKSGS